MCGLTALRRGTGFAFYALGMLGMLGMLGAAVVLVVWFARCCEGPGREKRGRTALVMGVAGAAALCDLIASAYLTAAGEERGCGFD
jgi:hypothetical protein